MNSFGSGLTLFVELLLSLLFNRFPRHMSKHATPIIDYHGLQTTQICGVVGVYGV